MDEKGKKICEIKIPGQYYVIIMGIIAIVLVATAALLNGFTIMEAFGNGLTIMIVIMILRTLKTFKIYAKCIIYDESVIYYEGIEKVQIVKKEYNVSPNQYLEKENYIRFILKDGIIKDFSLKDYSLKQVKRILEYIEKYSEGDVSQANSFLEQAVIDEKKDIKYSIILILIFIVIAIFWVKFTFFR